MHSGVAETTADRLLVFARKQGHATATASHRILECHACGFIYNFSCCALDQAMAAMPMCSGHGWFEYRRPTIRELLESR